MITSVYVLFADINHSHQTLPLSRLDKQGIPQLLHLNFKDNRYLIAMPYLC